MLRSASPRTRRRFARALVVPAVLAGLLAAQPAVAQKSKDPPPPKPGTACPTLGETSKAATGARVDCVKVDAGPQWHLRGSKPNPLAWGETARVVTEYATWQITVDSVDPDVTARVLAVDERNKPPKPGAKFVGLNLTLAYVGKESGEMVRNGAMLKAVGVKGNGIERWVEGAGTEDDCWANERVDKGGSKRCMMPFEVTSGDAQVLKFYAAKMSGAPVVYFSGTPPR